MSTATSRVFNKLNTLYDVLDDTYIKDDLLALNYSEEEAEALQTKMNAVMGELDNMLPGIQMAYQEENKNK